MKSLCKILILNNIELRIICQGCRIFVHSALKEYVRLLKRKKMLEFEGKIEWDGNLDEMRSI